MAKYVPDGKTQRWVIIAPQRTVRPHDAAPAPNESKCPFCNGNEAATPPEVYRAGTGDKNMPGWQVRVVPNKFPITDIHEVIIHSPSHTDDIEKLAVEQVSRILTTYRDRYRAHDRIRFLAKQPPMS
ncbi:MAG: Galactose-1-phosphate uridylyltransferase [Candidatus Gottesmanbacteria bacterium GW2011_GWA2_47_9]|uniref:Galactose-1-phosphate uridylyltransferase n=1 Tax=Candidatus Gottesmanbacteria bacterium GW2011_GWA2_47_9 TaxID=1618445 RepID=A0A0G1TV57_9BACT|nr:MAG: Galactose-1-phosphate uridylyltransferase [Candidatus Gottesmanbacteria bacterium GW2011_GWA2_47_9]